MERSIGRLGYKRGRYLGLLPDQAQVERKTFVPDGSGGQIVTTTLLGPYPCRLMANRTTPSEVQEGGTVVAITLWTAFLPSGTDVRPADVLVINNGRYEVTDENDAASDRVSMAVTLRRLR